VHLNLSPLQQPHRTQTHRPSSSLLSPLPHPTSHRRRHVWAGVEPSNGGHGCLPTHAVVHHRRPSAPLPQPGRKAAGDPGPPSRDAVLRLAPPSRDGHVPPRPDDGAPLAAPHRAATPSSAYGPTPSSARDLRLPKRRRIFAFRVASYPKCVAGLGPLLEGVPSSQNYYA
jgi:hypothetical protein